MKPKEILHFVLPEGKFHIPIAEFSYTEKITLQEFTKVLRWVSSPCSYKLEFSNENFKVLIVSQKFYREKILIINSENFKTDYKKEIANIYKQYCEWRKPILVEFRKFWKENYLPKVKHSKTAW